MKAYFDRTVKYYLTREPSFEAVQVEVDEQILDLIAGRGHTLIQMQEAIENAGAPEDSAQELTNLFVALLESEKDLG